MAEKREKVTKHNFDKFCAFWAIVIIAVIWLLQLLLGWLAPNFIAKVNSWLDWIKYILIFFAIFPGGHTYAKTMTKGWYVVFWVGVVIYVLVGLGLFNPIRPVVVIGQ